MKLVKLITIEGTMTCTSGLHIGGNNDGTKVGGSDNTIIRNPMNGKPYIPGSSVKGVMRSTLEKGLGKSNNGKPCGCGRKDCIVCTLFGAHMNTRPECGEPRLRIFDMQIDEEFEQNLINSGRSFYDIIESVSSTMIDRSTGMAYKEPGRGGSLRSTERVAAGTKFHCKFIIKVFEGDNEKKLLSTVENLITHLENIGLGAKTSSGSGNVKFDIDWDNIVSESMGF